MKKTFLFIIVLSLFVWQGALAQPSGDEQVKINIIIDNMAIEASLNASEAAQDLLSRLPITIEMHQHQNREYYGNIRLHKNVQTQDGYQIGDIGYWAAGNALVLFYDKGYTGDLSIVGQMTTGFEKLSNLDKTIQVRIEKP